MCFGRNRKRNFGSENRRGISIQSRHGLGSDRHDLETGGVGGTGTVHCDCDTIDGPDSFCVSLEDHQECDGKMEARE